MTMEAEREAGEEDPRRPLLPPSPSSAAEHQQQYQHLGRSSSSAQRGGGGGWAEVSAAEVKSAAPFSSTNYYPPAPNHHHDAAYPPPSTAHHDAVYPPPSTEHHDGVYPPPSTAHHDAVYPPPSTEHHDGVYPPPSTAHHDAVYPPPSTEHHDGVYPPPSTAHHDAVYPPPSTEHHDGVYPPPSTAHHDAVYPPPSTEHHDGVYPPPSTAHHDAVYPPPSTAAPPPHTHGLEIVPQGPYPDGGYYEPSQDVRRDVLDEVEARRLLIEHVGHRCCWGSRPARTWKITSIKDCSDVYVGTLETFIEQRDEILQKEPYDGGEVDGRDKGPVLGVWELDLRSEFPMLFVPEKEVMVKIPHSQATEKCSKCQGRGEAPCPICNPGRQLGFYMTSQMIKCSLCDGRGLRAQQDGSDSVCWRCNGQGMLPCTACGSRGVVVCQKCNGCGSLLAQSIARVRWMTLTAREVSATAGSGSVPDEVFHRAQGVQLCNIRAYQCTPAFFADSYPLSLLSSEVVASRLPVPPSAIVHLERHIISVVPVTRVTMSDRKRSFSFYVVGYGRDVFVRDYPSRFCWGFCRCFEWLWN